MTLRNETTSKYSKETWSTQEKEKEHEDTIAANSCQYSITIFERSRKSKRISKLKAESTNIANVFIVNDPTIEAITDNQ